MTHRSAAFILMPRTVDADVRWVGVLPKFICCGRLKELCHGLWAAEALDIKRRQNPHRRLGPGGPIPLRHISASRHVMPDYKYGTSVVPWANRFLLGRTRDASAAQKLTRSLESYSFPLRGATTIRPVGVHLTSIYIIKWPVCRPFRPRNFCRVSAAGQGGSRAKGYTQYGIGGQSTAALTCKHHC